jgi:signal transduction histidine kinase
MQATLCLPLLSGEEVLLGCVFLGKRASGKPYSGDDIRFAQSICNQAAIALENARLHQRASESERLAALGRMASTIVHDLRGPIGGMMRSVEALGREALPLDVRDRLSRGALETMERLYRMAQQVLDYARGDWTLNCRSVDAREFIERLLPVLEIELEENGIHLVLDITYGGEIWMDPDRMAQVVYNLVGNARDAMSDGGTLTLGVHEDNGEVQMVFADEGVGIPSERLARIFEPFVSYKGDRGAGLGLAICRKIVEDHSGDIRVSSQVGVGSIFVVTLPRRPESQQQDQPRSTQP